MDTFSFSVCTFVFLAVVEKKLLSSNVPVINDVETGSGYILGEQKIEVPSEDSQQEL